MPLTLKGGSALTVSAAGHDPVLVTHLQWALLRGADSNVEEGRESKRFLSRSCRLFDTPAGAQCSVYRLELHSHSANEALLEVRVDDVVILPATTLRPLESIVYESGLPRQGFHPDGHGEGWWLTGASGGRRLSLSETVRQTDSKPPGRCDNCRHFEIGPDGSWADPGGTFGMCQRIRPLVMAIQVKGVNQPMPYYAAVELGSVFVHPSFGCSRWERGTQWTVGTKDVE